jgi:tetratricopeptide (TPR) repeat protein
VNKPGYLGLILLVLCFYSALGDPTPEPTPSASANTGSKTISSGLDKAINAYDEAIRDNPSSANAYALRGAAKYAKGDTDGALPDVEEALAIDSHCISALLTRARIRQKKGDNHGALQDLTALSKETPKSFEVWAALGLLQWNSGDLDGALQDFNAAIDLAPNLKEALTCRAGIYARRSAYRDAVQDLNRAIEVDPSYEQAFLARGECELYLNKLDAARNDYDKAIELDPVAGAGFQGLAFVALYNQDPQTALDYFNRAIRLNAYPPAYVSRAVAEIALGDYHEAIIDLSEAEHANPKDEDGPETLLWVARALSNDVEGANAELQAYLDERKSTDPWGLKRARFLLGEIDEDLFLHKVARAPSELCEAYFYSGLKRLLAGDKPGAMDLFDTCTRFEIRGFIEDQLARIKLKELATATD